jgi:hypothetical protein
MDATTVIGKAPQQVEKFIRVELSAASDGYEERIKYGEIGAIERLRKAPKAYLNCRMGGVRRLGRKIVAFLFSKDTQ